ncbi:uncharacterized protein LOC130629400 [Hydractinia symbiolongicarpus]|uniref:uncharacterized protein LOC130629400 n=1 Tax=Hydractinia symbiolongicarpus TaxID=13093 RepID=UPI00254B0D79|nr:uncharacterized protein LOC130629400 [Hydractinia symbiolongicarpus]
MAVRSLNLPTFPEFSTEDVSTLSSRWKKYKQRFELLCHAIGVTDESQKLAMLLTYVGDSTYEIYENVKPEREEDVTYPNVVAALEKHFEPQVNKSYETYLFRNMIQQEDETIHQYFIRLKEQAVKCDFHDKNFEIKRQIELSTTNNKLRLYSFRNPDKTLEEILVTGKTLESTIQQAEVLQKAQANDTERINELRSVYTDRRGKPHSLNQRGMSKRGRPQNAKFYRCDGPFPHQNRCPAENQICNACGNQGHFSKCCRTKTYRHQNTRARLGRGSFYQSRQPLNNVTHSPLNDFSAMQNTLEAESDDEITENTSNSNHSYKNSKQNSDFHTVVKLEGGKVNFLVDTGASINILTLRTFNQLNERLPKKLNLLKTKTSVVTYGSDTSNLTVLGRVNLLVETTSKMINAPFFVIDTSHENLLSGRTAVDLDVI